ncbi:glycosyltransferase family A protein [Snuella sedimenti]|uniref:Glycosyltransferase family 2 protein n=1 Tax=Snuella sedimenti TaxID=2798802 RepID=A0A8J7IQJ1_9FLAO|nr:glycosyltransferase family A protein [Snuella sedimenti]MBJ6369297.1 glycosyltransferase family 2 protein [Snuella sedimenti]
MDIEILISTMFKTDLSFLEKMFPYEHYSGYNILIINQTTKGKILKSHIKNVRVINSLDRGSPVSRNLAIRKAEADICLMSDDDVVYQPNLKATVMDAYKLNPDIDMISFEAIDEQGNPYANYSHEGRHTRKTLKHIYTWVISFRRNVFSERNVFFNHYFGVGSVFKGETEYLFLRNAYDKGLKMYHVSKTIVMHPNESSGRNMGSDNAIFARAALHQRFYSNLSYVWLIKYLFFLIRHNYIKINEIPHKFRIGLKGVKTYKVLKNTGVIDKVYEGEIN